MTAAPKSTIAFRNDIQILRAIAVALVVLYHAKVPLLHSGFLGVDIFFVISGYLIGRIIIKEADSGTFSFGKFYLKRAWRLLPAAYTVFFAVLIISPFLLTATELKDLFWQVVGALTFTSNIVLWRQAGYFGGEALLKPLLHTWSLAIEEQFYIFLPILLVLIRGKVRMYLVSIAALISFTLAVYFRESVSASFFLLPTRAWELLIGVIVAEIVQKRGAINLPRVIYALSFGVVLGIPFIELQGFHPGPQAAMVCLATAIILASKPYEFPGAQSSGILYIGAISYSLYLVHWPLFAFLNNMNFSSPWRDNSESLIRIAFIFLSIILANFLHRFVEEKFRHGSHFSWRLLGPAGVILSAVVALFFVPHVTQGRSDEARAISTSEVCEATGSFSMETACRSGENPRILVWGDSFAMHLVPGLADGTSSLEVSIVHATRGACGPFIDFALKKTEVGFNQRWAESCIRFNDSVITALSENDSVEVVVLASPFSYLLENPEGILVWSKLEREFSVQSASTELGVQAISNTVEQLRRIGKRVVIVAPPPSGSFDMGRCGRRLVQGLPNIGVDQNCRFARIAADALHSRTMQLLSEVSQRHNIEVIQLVDLTCDELYCESVVDGFPLYVDGGHLSVEGSVWIASQLDLRNAVWDLAR